MTKPRLIFSLLPLLVSAAPFTELCADTLKGYQILKAIFQIIQLPPPCTSQMIAMFPTKFLITKKDDLSIYNGCVGPKPSDPQEDAEELGIIIDYTENSIELSEDDMLALTLTKNTVKGFGPEVTEYEMKIPTGRYIEFKFDPAAMAKIASVDYGKEMKTENLEVVTSSEETKMHRFGFFGEKTLKSEEVKGGIEGLMIVYKLESNEEFNKIRFFMLTKVELSFMIASVFSWQLNQIVSLTKTDKTETNSLTNSQVKLETGKKELKYERTIEGMKESVTLRAFQKEISFIFNPPTKMKFIVTETANDLASEVHAKMMNVEAKTFSCTSDESIGTWKCTTQRLINV